MTIQAIAIALLVIRLISLGFVVAVLARQIRLFRLSVDSHLVTFRVVMFLLGVVFLLGHLLPVAVDVNYAFFSDSDDFNILVWYALSNALSGIAAAILLWKIYQIAGKELDIRQQRADALDELTE